VTEVFTPEWVKEISDRYDRLPAYERPTIYFLASTKNGCMVRSQIEQWASDLPSEALATLIPRLRSKENFQDAYHELIVGNRLKELGFRVEYEKKVGGLTPDWYVHAGEDTPAFTVEVLTDKVSRAQATRNKALDDLRGRVEQIPLGVVLVMRVEQNDSLDSRTNKALYREIEAWLQQAHPPLHAAKRFGLVRVEIAHRNDSYSHVQVILPYDAFVVNRQPLHDKIMRKIDRYKSLAVTPSLPFVVAIVPTIATGRSLDTLEDVLFGQEAVHVRFEHETGAIISTQLTRQPDGLLDVTRTLSGIMWFDLDFSREPKLQFIPNPGALLPLPSDLISNQ
jgi:hypothetical protein